MSTTAITVKARLLGTAVVVTIPKVFRDTLGIRPKQPLRWARTRDGLVLTKAPPTRGRKAD